MSFKNIRKYLNKIIKSIPCKDDLPTVIVLLLIVGLFLAPFFQQNDLGGDFMGTTVPWYHFLYTSLRHGIIPFWSPYSYLGLPFIFSPSLALFHPMGLLAVLLNFIFNFHNPSIEITGKIIQYLIIVATCVGAVGMYAFCRRILNISKLAAVFAAVAFSLNPFLIHDISGPVPWGVNSLPWIFLFLTLFLAKPNFKFFLLVVIGNVLIFATGYPYYYVYFILAEIALAMFYGPRKLFLFAISLVNSLLLSSFFLLPYLYIFLAAGRSGPVYDFTWHSFASQFPTGILLILNPLTYSVDLLKYPDFHQVFSGAVLTFGTFAFVFLIYGLFFLKNKPIYMWTVITFFISFFYSFGSNLASHSFFGTLLPVIYQFRSHNRIFALTVFAGAILISLGAEAIGKRLRVKYLDMAFWFICLSTFIGLTLGPVFFWSKIVATAEFYKGTAIMLLFLFSSLALIAMTMRYGKKGFLILGLVIMLIEYHYYFPSQKGYFAENNVTYAQYFQLNPTIPEFPSSNNLFRIYFESHLSDNSSVINEYNLQGYENNVPLAYGQLIAIYGWSPRLWQVANVKYVITANADFGVNKPELVRINTINPSAYPDKFLPNELATPYYVYEVKNYLPRFYIPKKAEPCLNSKCWVKENAPELVIAKDLSDTIINPKNGAKINVKSYALNNIEMEITTPQPTFIASSETYDKGWSLSINNKPSKIYIVSNGLRGFVVPAGKSVVKMSYFPPYIAQATFLSVMGVVFLFGAYIFQKRKEINYISKFSKKNL